MFAVWLLVALAPTRCLPFQDVGAPVGAPAVVVVATPAPVAAEPPVKLPPPPVSPRPVSPPPAPPPVARAERARYRIDYGVLEIGELEVASARARPGATRVRAAGRGTGGIFGLGHMENRIATEFDLGRLDSRRWVDARSGGDRALRDHAAQESPGQIKFERQLVDDAGAPTGAAIPAFAQLGMPVLDPLGFLLRVRIAPPVPGAAAQILYVLDGQALWRVTIVGGARVALVTDAAPVFALLYDAEAEPIRYDGQLDLVERTHRSFRLWLSDDDARVPLRLQMPVGIADVVVSLTALERA